MTSHPDSSPSPHTDLPSGPIGDAVRAATSGDIVVTAQETEQAWQLLQARMAGMIHESATVVGTIAPASAVRRKPLWWSYAAAALLTVGAVSLWQRLSHARDVVSAPLGQRVAVTLPDGSSITLAAGSTASWVRGFRGGAREIMLDGEAFFDVVHDEQRPFLVHARDGVAQDVGTRFIVRAWPELAQVEVAVEDGVVAFADSAAARTMSVSQRVQLHAGQRGRLADDGSVSVLRADSAAFSWLTGSLAFADVPANEAVAVIGRWYGVDIAVDPTLASRRLTARFVSQPLPQLLDALAVALSARVERRGMQITLTP